MSTSIRWSFNWGTWSPSPQQFRHAISLIQPEEKLRLGRFVFRKDVRASLAGRLLMRKFVSESLKVPYHLVKLFRDENNRPSVENDRLLFNVSHQGSYTVLAGEKVTVGTVDAKNLKLGIDIMKLEYTGGKKIQEFFRIMDRNFSVREWKEIRSEKSEKEQVDMFCRHWALKESYVKAIGTGLVENLQELDFATKSKLEEKDVVCDTVLYNNGTETSWKFEETVIDGHCVAVAISKELAELKGTDGTGGTFGTRNNPMFQELTYENLISGAQALDKEDEKYCDDYFLKSERP
ncbi:L-aminoadipate-semialdehyde dehydrogenase-phosphopantetheinyl transferase isoform X2 [Cotesia glomerata]|uniref:L-aminoadipate-semialdehyde dehydrogenase-phosphopantetheinyl transferase isoform X1 n=1 Tax=Cotesia glomerata TaxID=32391 RepID=UPI001D00DE87|nr:L-aminoadipate-semialdehyde dehydrogenase-phosphopantetheinyl transferase isoform X1 [Cotesia glomerata]XP_044583247.1 L-aminoadipate-semialdehyde dehydrogenase-phosphopantetheinyl transferase isoform X2 [Cotesia glomerata]